MLNNIQNGCRRTIAKIFIFGALIWLALLATPAFAQVFMLRTTWACTNTQSVMEILKTADETVKAIGKTQVGEDTPLVMTIWAGKNGSWSIITTNEKNPNISCIVLTGDEFLGYDVGKSPGKSPENSPVTGARLWEATKSVNP